MCPACDPGRHSVVAMGIRLRGAPGAWADAASGAPTTLVLTAPKKDLLESMAPPVRLGYGIAQVHGYGGLPLPGVTGLFACRLVAAYVRQAARKSANLGGHTFPAQAPV